MSSRSGLTLLLVAAALGGGFYIWRKGLATNTRGPLGGDPAKKGLASAQDVFGGLSRRLSRVVRGEGDEDPAQIAAAAAQGAKALPDLAKGIATLFDRGSAAPSVLAKSGKSATDDMDWFAKEEETWFGTQSDPNWNETGGGDPVQNTTARELAYDAWSEDADLTNELPTDTSGYDTAQGGGDESVMVPDTTDDEEGWF